MAANKQQLEANNSSLEFKLLRHKFLSLISSGQSIEAVKYSKNLGHFFPSVKRGIVVNGVISEHIVFLWSKGWAVVVGGGHCRVIYQRAVIVGVCVCMCVLP